MNPHFCCIVLKIFVLVLISVLFFGVSQSYASTFEFTLETNHEQVDVSGKATPQSQVFLTVWNDEQEIMIENQSMSTNNENGSFLYQLSINDLSGYGHYTAELVHEGLTQGFEFSLKDRIDSPLQQMKNGITPEEIVCKANLVKMYKSSSSESNDNNAACVKSSSMDRLLQRGYSVEINTTTPDPLLNNIDEFTISDTLKETIRERVDNGTHQSLFVGIIDKDGIEQYYYGQTAKDGSPIDENTIFETGSISKVFTSLILADMVGKGVVNLDDPIDKFLPEDIQTHHLTERR